ncbi:MAG: Mu transposase domain-containing protein, partial [Candidatus Limnocylindria bacterium]
VPVRAGTTVEVKLSATTVAVWHDGRCVARHERQAGTRAMVELLQLGRSYGQPRLRAAIEEALALGCSDGAAVHHLVAAPDHDRPRPASLELGALARFERPLPDVTRYDRLLLAGGRR